METAEEPALNLRQTLEWLRKELVRLCISFYLVPPPSVFQGSLVPLFSTSLAGAEAAGWGVGAAGTPLGPAMKRSHHLGSWDK